MVNCSREFYEPPVNLTAKELDQIVHDVAAIVLATPAPYSSEAVDTRGMLLEHKLQAYLQQIKASKQ